MIDESIDFDTSNRQKHCATPGNLMFVVFPQICVDVTFWYFLFGKED
jgi:hypothetical protein